MPTARYTGGGHYRIAGHGFDPGDEQEVDPELARYLAAVEDFGISLEKNAGEASDQDASEEDADTGEAPPDGSEDDEFDPDAFLDRTPVEDVADDILAGEADEHLNEIADAADRVTVQDAVGERRAELED